MQIGTFFTMKIHFFQHVPFEGLGIIEDWIHVKGYELTATRFFNGEKILSPISPQCIL